jgi:hypothetical protein
VSIPIPLAVRLRTARADRHVTADLRDLRFRSVVPGGFASAQASLHRPLTLMPDEIGYYADLYVYDARNGATVWQGQVEDLGRTAGADGQVWDLAAIGPSSRAKNFTAPLIYIDQSLTPWVQVDRRTAGAEAGVSTDPGDTTGLRPALVMRIAQGTNVTQFSNSTVRYNELYNAQQKLARCSFTWDGGVSDANWAFRAITRDNGSLLTGEDAFIATLNTAGGSGAIVIDDEFPPGRNTVDLLIIQSAAGSGTVPNDTYWGSAYNVKIIATRYDLTGTEITSTASYTNNYVLASEVVTDLLGRLLGPYGGYDAEGATVATTAYHIDSLAYPSGASPAQIFDDLMALEPAYYWAAWETTPAGGHRFEWRDWPTSVRYEADTVDGLDSPASAANLFSDVTVRYKDVKGYVQNYQASQTIQALSAAGLRRWGYLDLGDEAGSTAAAQQAAEQFLAEHTHPPNAGRLTIARPILDRDTGRMVQPWEIRPGHLIRIRGILPSVDSLNATTRDGTTVFKIASAEYAAATAAATLELDSYSLTTARAIADLQRRAATTSARR